MYDSRYLCCTALACFLSLWGIPLRAGNSVFAANCCLSGSSVTIVNELSQAQAPGVPVPGSAVTVAISPDGMTVFAATQNPDTILAISAGSHVTGPTAALAGSPVALAASPDGSILYVARCAVIGDHTCGAGSVDVFSAADLTIISSIPVPQGTPGGLSLDATGANLYVTTGGARDVGTSGIAVIDTAQKTQVGFLPESQSVLGAIVVLASDTNAFIADLQFPTIHRIDLTTGQTVANVHLQAPATGIVLSPDGSALYAVGQYLTAISTLTNAVSFRSNITLSTAGVAVSPDGANCYIADSYESTLDTFDLASQSVTARVPTGFRPAGVVVTPDGTTSFVADSGSSTVSQFTEGTNAAVAQAEAGSEPKDVKISPDGKFLYAVNAYSSNVSVLSTSPFQRITSIPTGYLPMAAALSPDGTRLYVSTYDAAITVIDTAAQTVIGTILTAPDGSTLAYGMAVTRDGKRLYALTSYRDFSGILVIDTDTLSLVKSIPVTGDLGQIALGPADDFAYISGDSDQPFLIVVDLGKGQQAEPIFTYKPFGVKVSPLGNYIYTGTTDSPSIVVIDRHTGKVASQTPVAGTLAIALSSDGLRLYATGPVVSIFDTQTRTVVATVDTGGPSFGITAQ